MNVAKRLGLWWIFTRNTAKKLYESVACWPSGISFTWKFVSRKKCCVLSLSIESRWLARFSHMGFGCRVHPAASILFAGSRNTASKGWIIKKTENRPECLCFLAWVVTRKSHPCLVPLLEAEQQEAVPGQCKPSAPALSHHNPWELARQSWDCAALPHTCPWEHHHGHSSRACIFFIPSTDSLIDTMQNYSLTNISLLPTFPIHAERFQ